MALSARDFLASAEANIAAGDVHSLLHAGLDVRLGIESRLHEYLDATEEIVRLTKRGWQVRDLARDLERVFRLGEKIARLQLLEGDTRAVKRSYLHTPVRKDLRGIAERLGDYLHYSERTRPNDPKWIEDLTTVVTRGVEGLRFATTGTMLAPPIWHEATGEAKLFIEVVGDFEPDLPEKILGKPGDDIHVSIDYLDDLP